MGQQADQVGWTSLLLLERFRGGDERAAEALFARYYPRLTALARRRLSARLARRADPEDLALSAYQSFFRHARAGRYTLGRGGDLWRLLSAITRHKVLRRVRHESAARRSPAVEVPLDEAAEVAISRRTDEPSPEAALELAEEVAQTLAHLDPLGQQVLELRLQGDSIAAIAEQTGRSERTVRRSLAQIRAQLADRPHP